MKKLSIFLKTLLVAVGIGVGSSAWAQTAYWTEDFEDDLGTGWTLSGASRQSNSSMDKKLGTTDLRIEKKADAAEAQYVITPTFSKGVSTITFWQCRSSNRTLTIYTSIDDGTNWTKHSDVTANSSTIATVTINNPFVNRIKIANESSSDADLDDLTVYHKNVVWKENYESTTLEAQQSVWTKNDTSWPTGESVGTYASRLYLFDNQCGNSTKWFCAASKNGSRQTTAYYFFASAYTGKAYQFDAKLNLNVGNNNAAESRLYFMNGAKSGSNTAPSNYLFYIGVNSEGKIFISNGTDSDVSTIGGISGTENISNVVQEAGKNYKSTGWFNASCLIDIEGGEAKVTVRRSSTEETLSINLKTGTKQLSGLGVLDGAKTGGVVAMDDVALYELTYPAFTLAEDTKDIYVEENGTINVSEISGEISVESNNTSVATASYSDGTITINGVAEGAATITVKSTSDGIEISKTIDATILGYSAKYTREKTPYDTKVANLDAAGQAYWSTNVIDASSVTNSSTYSSAVAALPTTYIAAVKVQTTAGSDMTGALKTEVSTDSWTNATGTYGGVATERYNNNTPYSSGKILYQTVDGLHAGYYRVKFYGVANVARTLTEEYYGSGIAQMYANSETQDVDVIYQDACSPISDTYLREFEVYLAEDNSSIEFGIQNIKEGGQWYVAQAHSLTYLGTEKNDYTINAVAGETTIKQLGTGKAWASDDYGTYVPYVIEKDSKFYVLDDNSTYYKGFTMGATDETKEISYTLDESIVYYREGENLNSSSTGDNLSNGGYGHIAAGNSTSNKGYSIGTFNKGVYQASAYFVSADVNKNRGFYVRNSNLVNADGANVLTYISTKTVGLYSSNFQLTENTPLTISGYTTTGSNPGKVNQSAEFDYVLIRRLNVNDDPAIVGDVNNATAYCAATSDKKTLKPGESYHYRFVNHNSNGSNNWKNWVLPVYDTSDTQVIVVRADNYEDCHHVGETWGSNAGCTSTINWTGFVQNMDGAIVDMTVTFTADKKFNMTSTISPSDGSSDWTYSYTNDYTDSSIDLTGNDYIKVALSVSESWLEILSEEQTAVAATLGTNGYGTFASPYPLDLAHLPEGLTAYKASSISGKTVTFTAVTEAVQANTGLLLKGDAGESETIVSIPVAASGADISESNEFLVNTSGTTFTGDNKYYYFGLKKNTLTFGLFEPSTVAIPANKAYLKVLKSSVDASRSLSIVFDDDATAVFDLNDKSEMINDKWYDLQGRRVDGSRLTVNGSRLNPGIYIKNGRKVVVK